MAIRLLYNTDIWDAATVTASSEASSELGAENVIDPQPAKVWRSTGDASEWIKFDLGSATLITCIGIFKHNFTAAATITLEANSSDSWASPAYSQVLTVATDDDSSVLKRIVFFLSQTYRYWRITIADAANPAGYIEMGRVIAGQYWEATRNIRDGYRYIENDSSAREKIPGVWTPSVSADRFRTVEVSFAFVGQTQVDKMRAIFNKIGNENTLILALEPTTRPSIDSMYCMLETPMAFVSRVLTYWDVVTLVFEEKVK